MDKNAIVKIKTLIENNIEELTKTKEFVDELSAHPVHDGDLILINNSFILRKPLIKTKKNSQFLLLKVKGNKPDTSEVYVSTPSDFDQDFKIVNSKQAEKLSILNIELAIEQEVQRLGQLIFFLIGDIVDCSYSTKIQNHQISELKFDPCAGKPEVIGVDGKNIIVINQLTDPVLAWNIIKPELEKIPNINLDDLEKMYAQSFEKIQNEARLIMNLPPPASPQKSNSFVEQLRESVTEQMKLYKSALEKCISGQDPNEINLREIMRISYNFADDAIKIMQLLVSLSDLKAVVLWSTLKSHFDLAESIRNLPWSKSDKKASPDYYVEKIKGARNHAFHHLLLFDRTIEADLSDVQVKAKKLTILPPYSQRKNNVPLDYEDREIVEILSEITRATETVVTLDFWIKNLAVLESFERLLRSTNEVLWLLNSAT